MLVRVQALHVTRVFIQPRWLGACETGFPDPSRVLAAVKRGKQMVLSVHQASSASLLAHQ